MVEGFTKHLFIIRVKNREELKAFLLGQGIVLEVYYPVPFHEQEYFNNLKQSIILGTSTKLSINFDEESQYPNADFAASYVLAFLFIQS